MKLARTLTLGVALTGLVLLPLPGCMRGGAGGGCGQKLMGLMLSVGAAVGTALLIKEIS